MKKSRFNIITDAESNKKIIYNTYTGALAVLDYESYKQFNSENIKEDKLLGRLIEGGYIIKDDNVNEINYIKGLHKIYRYTNESLILTITPTLLCNMNCPYCYEEKKNSTMNEETMNNLITFIDETLKKYKFKNLVVSWYGGEPLLMIDKIIELSKSISLICNNNSVKIFQLIVTNGYLLNKDNILKLKELDNLTTIQVSLDGYRDNHDLTRRLKSGERSFDKIINNIKEAADLFYIVVRVNIKKDNVSDAYNLLSLFEDIRLKNKVQLYFAPIRADTNACAHVSDMCLTTKEFANFNSEILFEAYKRGFKFPFFHYPKLNLIGCSSVSPYTFVIDPEGNMCKCWNEVGINEYMVGNIKEGILLNTENLKWINYSIPDKCYKCVYLPICSGGCPYERIRNISDECDHRKYLLDTVINLYYKKYKEKEIS